VDLNYEMVLFGHRRLRASATSFDADVAVAQLASVSSADATSIATTC
jgi:hypothetical protein